MTGGELAAWANFAVPGESCVYFVRRWDEEDANVFATARLLARKGLVTLFQRRAEGATEFFAVTISPFAAKRLGEPWPCTAPWSNGDWPDRNSA